VADEVMLDDPGIVDADLVGEFDLLDDAAIMRLRVAQVGQIGRKIEQPELHRRAPRFCRMLSPHRRPLAMQA
jgi:hypothetical protein